jgi:hypothetical protein
MEYMTARQASENGVSRSAEYKFYALKGKYLALSYLERLGRYQKMLLSRRMVDVRKMLI